MKEEEHFLCTEIDGVQKPVVFEIKSDGIHLIETEKENDDQKQKVAQAITKSHSNSTGAPKFYVQVIFNDIDAVFMEVSVIAERKEIEFQGFAFHQFVIRDIADDNAAEIRLACFRAKACKFWTVKLDKIIIFRMFILKCL